MPDDVWPEPAYVVRTKRLELRCYERSDVATVHEVILDNTEALRPWMPWIQHEPMSLEERGELLRAFRARFDSGEDFIYGVFDRDGGAYIGGCGLHPRVGARALEIGYWIAEDRWGQGLATELAAALTRVGFERMEAERMEIRVVPHNTRSLAVPRKLGYTRKVPCAASSTARATAGTTWWSSGCCSTSSTRARPRTRPSSWRVPTRCVSWC